MKIGIPKEIHPGEKRVATTPEAAEQIIKLGFSVLVETGAGLGANISDEAYKEAGADIVDNAKTLWEQSDIVIKVRAPERHPELTTDESDLLREGGKLISFIWPAQNPELMEKLASKQATVLAMDSVPRMSRAQKLDALSSMANIAGYRAIVEAAQHFGRFFTGQITAAGKIPPAKVLVIGAGVAGLAAIGAAKGMGAIVRAFDTRPEVKEQIESMDAEFLMLDFKEEGSGTGGYAKTMSKEFIEAEMALFARQAMEVDIIVTTALIPGKPAPKLITQGMVKSMKPGSVIVDLAAEQGGNCELTEKDQVVVRHDVTIIGYTNLPSRLANQSSQLYSTNIRHLLTELSPEKNGEINVNMDDEVIRGATVIKEGKITWPPPPPKLSAAPTPQTEAPAYALQEPPKAQPLKHLLPLIVGGLLLFATGAVAPETFMTHFTVFVLACFIGYQVIWNVSPSLHTPLMSVTNAISGIIVIGALVQVSSPDSIISILAGLAILIASINIAGGFLVTRRMLEMFRK
ncbi:MAG: Re/Si-specific NAD(P)(+) transhydrogenase subunit alpha [Methylococcaceae bacterium]|jgi:NAD(P) transhydrogenase subunit alpha|nr:Re/Si-specific NAD(P)(+) transhydrogenase subunit alpha [Methylococcaceae bacterium]MDZ4158122.1 Re/Si-specific NAD(P)(+) transhydrogenase subunit alpha [Methylococcales bacterium]MDP2392913.1 Re/Si-specific NAD(P)(+) transhydrogenase subunit alpha [Methylococcaceae bacterium]MDP3020441.1 Re/Si-specific NAD(P)(+) transhydrogenase subunit alpha [Methylococcaceae bacterium]MDP3390926.1 Re/Si-specific NAD(P)(+) transhydrogenase subunit alpha [Methylococcaceae bacterium]